MYVKLQNVILKILVQYTWKCKSLYISYYIRVECKNNVEKQIGGMYFVVLEQCNNKNKQRRDG